jgi:hypothetical protein
MHPAPSDDDLLDRLQRAAFDYFLKYTVAGNGLVADTSRPNSPVSIAVVGFALSAYTVAVERGWITRADAVERILSALRFFRNSEQDEQPRATGWRGFYYHFLDRDSGVRTWDCELSMVDTALLIAGALTARSYFDGDGAAETELREIADALYLRIDWRWALGGEATLRQGWKPECGFLHYGWDGYNEAIVLYALALGSPSHAPGDGSYEAWTATYQWENLYGVDFLYAGPLFVHQFSHAWIDFRGIRDAFMREKRCDYFENSRRALQVQREYALRNPGRFAGYGADGWGLSACDGPGAGALPIAATQQRLFGYAARGVPYGPDDGTLCAPSTLASLPFGAEDALRAVRREIARYPEMLRDEALASAFNPSLAGAGEPAWVSPGTFGLDQGLVVMMIENHRSQLIWKLMRRCAPLVAGLRRAGFRGGWLKG